jgi:serine/threonine protein kinase/tetratricopeptide (TPR) repeat protein
MERDGRTDTSLPGTLTRSPAEMETVSQHGPATIDVPERIGPYRVHGVLGVGGMGVVFFAEQTEPIQREVALKIIKLGMDTKDVVARFEAESQALALMDHPNIARVYEAGATETGRPYFAMELVRGVPLTKHCDAQRLRTRERVELFIQVCQAVQHAHQKGVIHRDLKPSNVIVTVHDGRPVPKVIDFGIAKAMDRRLTDRTLVTEIGQVIGTPVYMSPEQLEMTSLDIDTRTDVYSLGVMLYELLTGTLPHRAEDLRLGVSTLRTGPEDPPVPSDRVVKLGVETEIPARRQADTRTLRRELKGDLDWIVMKAMARERARRYETVNGLALDLQRTLSSEPIAARPPTARYRMGKFARRHKGTVAIAAAVASIVVGFAVAMTFQARRVARERDRAEREAARANATTAFLQDVLSSADPWASGAREITVSAALEKAVGRVGSSFQAEPLTAAAVRRTIGVTYFGLGRYADAEPLLLSALESQKKALGTPNAEVADTLSQLSLLRQHQGRYDESLQLEREALTQRIELFGDRSGPAAASRVRIAEVLLLKGEYPEAERSANAALAVQRDLFGKDSVEAGASLEVLMSILGTGLGDYRRADVVGREALEIRRRRLGPEHPQVSLTLNNLAVVQLGLGNYPEAEALYKESIAGLQRTFGNEHPEVATSMENLGGVYYRMKRYDESIALEKQVLAMRRKMLGDDHLAVARTLQNIAAVYTGAGQLEEAETAFRESFERLRRALGPEHPDIAIVLDNLAGLLKIKGERAAAEATWRDAIALGLKKLGPEHPGVARTRARLGALLVDLKRYPEAETLLLQARAAREKALGADHRDTRATIDELARLYDAWGRTDQAAAVRAGAGASPPN